MVQKTKKIMEANINNQGGAAVVQLRPQRTVARPSETMMALLKPINPVNYFTIA